MRSALLTGVSFVLTALVIGNAYFQRQQFYPSVVYITKSNSSMVVIYFQALVFVLLFGKLMSKVFFGRLRAAEFEHLMERSWYAVTETCLAFTVFEDDFSPKFVALFSLLLFLKSFHWLTEDRVDFMERSPSISFLFHVRLVSLSILLASLDLYFISHAYHSTLTKGASVQLVFGFEYAILLTIIVNTAVKYVLHCIDLHSENPWEGKAVCMLYSGLVIGFVKVLFYVLFIIIMVRINTLPLFTVRPMYLTMRSFKKAFNDVIMSRRAIHNMNTWYPDATPEELAATDNVCIICREEMLAPSTKKLPCNHIFHKTCLRSWFQRRQACPTCRLDVLRAPLPNQQQRRRPQQPQAPRPNQRPAQQPQPQQPQAGPQVPLPPFDPNAFARFFNQPAPQAQPQAQPTSTTSANSSTTFTTPPTIPLPSFPLPPFAFSPPPFTVPPPMPPPNFSGMTDQELSELEGRERSNVEARIKCLRNIQVLLDAAMLEMHQYTNVVSRLNTTAPTASAAVAAPAPASNASPPPAEGAAGSGDVANAAKEAVAKPVPSEETGAKPKTVRAPERDREKEEIVKKMDDKKDGSEDSLERQEVRKRWLEKFKDNGTSSDK